MTGPGDGSGDECARKSARPSAAHPAQRPPSTGSSRRECRAELREAGDDRQVGLVDAAELLDARMRVHEPLVRPGGLDQRVARGRGLAEAGAKREQEVGFAYALRERRVDRQPDVPDVAGRAVVEVVLAAEGSACRQAVRLDEREQVGGRLLRPAAAADDRKRALRTGEQLAQPGEVIGAGIRLHHPVRRCVVDVAPLHEHVFRKRQDDRSGPARRGDREGPREELGDANGVVDLGRPFGLTVEDPVDVHLLERLTATGAAGDLAHEQDHRRRVLERRVDADRRVRRAGASRDEAETRPAGELAVGLGHVRGAALLATGDQPDRVARFPEGVERRDVAFARDAEDRVGPVDTKLVDEDLPAAAAHGSSIVRSRRIDARCVFGFSASAGST